MEQNKIGHDPEGKVTAFMNKYQNHRVPIKLWGKKSRTDTGYVVESAFIYV